MKISKMMKAPGILSMTVLLATAGIQAPAMADIISTSDLAMAAELQMQRDDVRSLMARDDVRSAMLAYGVNPADIDARINSLTESELLQIQNQMAQLPAGGNVVGIVVGVILIFVLLDLLGATDVFPRI
ncbi:MAG: PA2779 family protein [Gammaproteobacteria bacterium]|nr:PA2779 family protein [Gammaproteobacteria bacterium]MDP2141731.1 PA2779 family protein [Gammaproteobacteria bacterium]MDP2347964.1 PA2779 family protein [Gammaproteobacteria bacterium]